MNPRKEMGMKNCKTGRKLAPEEAEDKIPGWVTAGVLQDSWVDKADHFKRGLGTESRIKAATKNLLSRTRVTKAG